jgi:hypothetical protein
MKILGWAYDAAQLVYYKCRLEIEADAMQQEYPRLLDAAEAVYTRLDELHEAFMSSSEKIDNVVSGTPIDNDYINSTPELREVQD